MSDSGVLLIGADGGATEVKTHAVACDDLKQPTSFSLRPEAASRVYIHAKGFKPVSVAEQFAQREAGRAELSRQEIAQGRLWTAAAAEAIVETAGQCGAKCVLVGMGMPGLKTPDGRGIDVINNGPRIPDYLDQLEKLLSSEGLALAAPIAELGSDADYCGLGEEYAEDGWFRDVENAYYVGCGTGVADALKLHGRVTPFDEASTWIQKSWQMSSAFGATFEKLVSAKSLNQVYENLVEDQSNEEKARRFPERAALDGCPIAKCWLDAAALVLAELVFERIWTIKRGRAVLPHRGEAYAKLVLSHKYRGTLLERVIIGQRLGQVYADGAYRAVFGGRVDCYLAEMIQGGGDDEMLARYLEGMEGRLKPGFIVGSKLRAAPALGAAAAAVRARA